VDVELVVDVDVDVEVEVDVDVEVEVVVVVLCVVVDVEPVVLVVVPCVVVDVLVVVGVVVVVLVVPPLTHLLASLLWSPGNDGPRRMSPACFECPLIQPLTLIEITTYGFVAEPVLWQTSTFCPFVFWAGGAGGGGGLAGLATGVDGSDLTFAVACAFAFASTFAFALTFAFDFTFVWPGALAELPAAALCCCEACFFCCPGAFAEFPFPLPPPPPGFPATAALAKPAMQRATSARTQSPGFLRSTISSLPCRSCTLEGARRCNALSARTDTACNRETSLRAKFGAEPPRERRDDPLP